jgi:Na+/H+ antiporter NhaD/arsenite permease-like protein
MLILWASGIISGVIDNIPYTATMAPMLSVIEKSMGADYTFPLWWCLSLGACLGGNLTIIGAAANVIVSENAASEGHPIPFMRFLKYGIAVVVISLIICTVYINWMYIKA